MLEQPIPGQEQIALALPTPVGTASQRPEPDAMQADSTDFEPSELEETAPDQARSDQAQSDQAQSDQAQPDQARSDQAPLDQPGFAQTRANYAELDQAGCDEDGPEADRLDPDRPDDHHARLELSQAVEPGDTTMGRLLERHRATDIVEALHDGSLADLEPEAARRDRVAERAVVYRLRLEPGGVEAAVEAAARVGARFLTPGAQGWPTTLDDLGAQRPIGLWLLGQVPLPAVAVSIVGARACTGYGLYVAGGFGTDLAAAGISVVSGAALGIDAAAHRGALAAPGHTTVVLACGIDRVYPRSHESLLRAVAERGAVYSELPPGTTPTRFRFLHRNRIISALGRATVVIEAAVRSGSLVTARLSAELGRPVLAVPGPVTSALSAGVHDLIRDGATLVTCADQVLEACREGGERPDAAPTTAAQTSTRGGFANRSHSRAAAVEPQPTTATARTPSDPIADRVAEALPRTSAGGGMDVLALARASGIQPDAVFAALGRLAATRHAVRIGTGWILGPGPAPGNSPRR